MGERIIGDLLEEIDNAPSGQKPIVGELLKNSDAPDVTQKLINEAWNRELIANNDHPLNSEPYTTVPSNISLILTFTGFEFLNQIRIKKAIVQLNNSSDESYKKMIELTGKLGLSVEKLYKSSGRIEDLNKLLIILTSFLAILTAVLIYLALSKSV